MFESFLSGDVSVHTKGQIAVLLCTKERQITLLYPAVQIQKGKLRSLCRHLMECLEKQTTTPFSSVKKKSTRVRYSERFRVYIAAAASQKTTTRWLNVKCVVNGTTICESIPKIVFASKTVEWFCLHCQLMK